MAAASVLVLGACDEQGKWTEPTGPVVNVVIATLPLNEPMEELLIGTTRQLIAGPVNEDGRYVGGQTVTWSSSNSAVVEVSPAGLATARSSGNVTITASAGGASGTIEMKVRFPVGQVSVTPTGRTIRREGAVQLSATVTDQSGIVRTNRTVTWSSSNPAVATVSSTGLVSGVTDGTVQISASSEGVSGSATVTVFGSPVVATITVTPANPLRGQGMTQQMVATARAGSGTIITDAVITWSSANPSVATVNPTTGLVNIVGVGVAPIVASTVEVTGTITGSTNITSLQVLQNGILTPAGDIPDNSVRWFMAVIPAGLPSFTITMTGPGTGGPGDADLYVFAPQTALPTGFGAGGSASVPFLCRPWLFGSNETCTINAPAAGNYLVGIHAYPGDGTSSGVSVRLTHP
jgi:uncharacterized protein YjdB